jgi:hypothetical protein
LAGNLVKPLLSLYGTEWRERGYGLSALTKAIHKDLEENKVFQVRGFFKLGFCLVLEKQASVWFSSDCLCLNGGQIGFFYISFYNLRCL